MGPGGGRADTWVTQRCLIRGWRLQPVCPTDPQGQQDTACPRGRHQGHGVQQGSLPSVVVCPTLSRSSAAWSS